MRAEVRGPADQVLVIDDGLLAGDRARAAAFTGPRTRLAYAAAHVVMKGAYRSADASSPLSAMIDWEATRGIRHRLAAAGFGIAEAMDTAQRFSIGWEAARRLIETCGDLRPPHGFIAGAGCDHLESIRSASDVVEGLVHQVRIIQAAGGIPMLLPTPWLSTTAQDEDTFVSVYRDVVDAVPGPLCVHWLGEAFMSEVRGYFPGASFERIMAHDPTKVRACKISLLDASRERAIRERLLRRDQFVLTGDDFNFPELIQGDGTAERSVDFGGRSVPVGRFSHALLGILDGIAGPAALALRHLDAGDVAGFRRLMDPCAVLARHVFAEPTRHYKTGLVFLAWLNGWQDHFLLADHEESARDRDHLWRVAELAAAAGVFEDAGLCARRLEAFFAE